MDQDKLELWVTSLSDTPRLQYYDVQTLEYRYISKLPMKNERIWSYVKETLNYLPFQILDSNHIPSSTSAGSVLQLCKVSQKSNKPFRRNCAYKVHNPPFRESISWIISPS